MFRRIYLDNSATTPVDPRVVEAMMPYLTEQFGNASSIHHFGQQAKSAVDKARHQVAHLIGSRPNEIVFTSGGTESNNLAIKGLWNANFSSRLRGPEMRTEVRVPHIITSAIEHSAVTNVCDDLEKQGYRVTRLPVYEDGIVRIDDLKAAIDDATVLISVMAANNEIGTLQPIEEIGKLVKELRAAGRKIWFHTDAVQAAGKVPLNVEEIGCDLLSMSAHKLYAPKGVGALYVRRGVRLHPQNIGGHQERDRRGGTESVPNIVAFGKACELASEQMGSESSDLKILRDDLESKIGEMIPDIVFNGNRDRRLPNISNISFRSIEGEGLLINLDMQGIAVSTGSACSSGTLEPSPVIRALCGSPHEVRASPGGSPHEVRASPGGSPHEVRASPGGSPHEVRASPGGSPHEVRALTEPNNEAEDRARGAIRFSLGRTNTAADIERLLEVLPTSVENLRRLSPARAGD